MRQLFILYAFKLYSQFLMVESSLVIFKIFLCRKTTQKAENQLNVNKK